MLQATNQIQEEKHGSCLRDIYHKDKNTDHPNTDLSPEHTDLSPVYNDLSPAQKYVQYGEDCGQIFRRKPSVRTHNIRL